ncbi:PREDICTED: reverse mRNAase [Prunus dulcis]|uniref:PREDICTED: reverse mRNAase n=1 Tax=Prunus dulcis TaxID=3755 RepID=A0A5E4G955_PRUDU|nr:PREDICTED: reverse mRNAase [Prunus dulcis]
MMLKLGFSSQWVEKVMDCISTTIFSVLLKGNPLGHITPQRGLWQGCLLSPYIFLMRTEGFSSLAHDAEMRGDLVGVQVAREAPSVTHVLFEDDSILFMNATEKACVLNIPIVQCPEKYLRLPTFARKGRKINFGGAKAIPTYSMSCFRISKGLCKKLNGIMARFWWAKAKTGIHWMWEQILFLFGVHFNGGNNCSTRDFVGELEMGCPSRAMECAVTLTGFLGARGGNHHANSIGFSCKS